MTNQRIASKTDLLASIEPAWAALNATLESLSVSQLTMIMDVQGWTVKDHIIHLTAWERSVVFLLKGQPRSAGLGVDPALFQTGSFDDINAVIFQQCKGMPLTEALAQFQEVHRQLMQLLQSLTDADLHQPYCHYVPAEHDDRSAMEVVYADTAGHFAEHLNWIETLLEKAP
jgi:hypothetical protein